MKSLEALAKTLTDRARQLSDAKVNFQAAESRLQLCDKAYREARRGLNDALEGLESGGLVPVSTPCEETAKG